MHPPHVPLHGEPQPSRVHRPRHPRVRSALFGHRHRPRHLVRLLIELLQELDRLQVVIAAVFVRNPLARLPAVIQIEHRRHRVHPQSVDVILLQPEKRIRDQEIPHLVAPEVEHQRAPLLVLTFARVFMLVAGRPVKPRQPVRILRKMRRYPVDNYAQIVPVAHVHEVPELIRRPKTRRRRKEAHHLITPGTRVRMLHRRHQLQMREAKPLCVGNQPLHHLAVSQRPAFRRLHPRLQMHFVHRHRLLQPVRPPPPFHPLVIPPIVVVQTVDDRPLLRRHFRGKAVRVAL